MKTRILREDGATVHLLVFEAGDEVVGSLKDFAAERGIAGAHFTALGAFREAKLAWFDPETKEYVPIYVEEQVEVASLVGNVALFEGEVRIHAHAVLGRRDGSTVAGHVLSGRVRPTLEMILVDEPASVFRAIDEASGLPLIDPSAS